MIKTRKRNHSFNKNDMSLTAFFTYDSGDSDSFFKAKEINKTFSCTIEYPRIIRTFIAGNIMKINEFNDFVDR